MPVSRVVQVIVAVPLPTAFTTPFESTVATFLLLERQISDLSVVSSGSTVATSAFVLPTYTVQLKRLSETEVDLTIFFTVTMQVATKPPSSLMQVMVVVPALLPSTVPFWSTEAMLSLSVIQLTFLFVAFSG